MAKIDPTARVENPAGLADDVEIGPYAVLGPDVVLKEGVKLLAHVNIQGATTIGARTTVFPFASLGTAPQSVHYKGERTELFIGSDCIIREHATASIGTAGGGGVTHIGNGVMMMTGSHVGHDCTVGDSVIFANNAVLGGHVSVGEFTFLGGQCAVHQFTRIGAQCMISGLTGVREDVIPFGNVLGQAGKLVGLNVIGMKRRGFSKSDLHAARAVYRDLFFGEGTFEARLETVREQAETSAFAAAVVSFIDADRKRPICQPSRGVIKEE
ncbi:acyl-ACP--UDP-N-acetylglucosamine O-acyltransferase [Xanthobacter oligotrophicus]|uniref:acyl-ACP--UDP-N-acetylglucosamine O-acyltransferase n=1 Tax=Xanthobacter oligotrophicus TaxID=2607286 RepID=UPI0011F1D959|nr:acyl-ACP--UDP-N-acetylglucosamine O-acyltransferase [Xanthobacter oligotrophicus]MCG5233620.1 acyl-ACP--UDP-N-acetylglucosamine O-acyltransferase [Xanthobacter oligotrophicus]